jgi:hypothetical protein
VKTITGQEIKRQYVSQENTAVLPTEETISRDVLRYIWAGYSADVLMMLQRWTQCSCINDVRDPDIVQFY